MAVVDVLKTEIAHSGFTSRRIGEYSEATGGNGASANDVTGERSKILRRLRPHAIVIR